MLLLVLFVAAGTIPMSNPSSVPTIIFAVNVVDQMLWNSRCRLVWTTRGEGACLYEWVRRVLGQRFGRLVGAWVVRGGRELDGREG